MKPDEKPKSESARCSTARASLQASQRASVEVVEPSATIASSRTSTSAAESAAASGAQGESKRIDIRSSAATTPAADTDAGAPR